MKSQAIVLNDFFNKTSFFNKSMFLLALIVSLMIFSLPALASKAGETADNSRVITLKPDQLSVIKGARIASFSLAAVSGGRMNPIPYQFDERTKSGYVYMPELENKLKDEDPLLGTEGFYDENDDLLFMLKDAGPRRKNGMATDGKVIAEIEVAGYDGAKGYVYLVEGARLESENYYVRFSSKLGRVETDYYALKVDPKNAFMWQEFYYDSFDGAHPRKPVDTIKIHMKANAIASVPVELTNKNIVAQAIAEKSGPVRSTTQYKMTLTYLKTPLLNMKLQILHYEQEINYDAQIEIPPVRRRLVGKPELKISIDGYDLQGAEVRMKGGPKDPAIVDGQISEVEKEMRATPLEAGVDQWLWLDSHYRFMLVSNFNVTGTADAPLEVLYEDEMDSDDKSEYYKGQLPNAGFLIPKLALEGTMRIDVELKMFNEELDISVEDFVNIVNRKPEIKVYKM